MPAKEISQIATVKISLSITILMAMVVFALCTAYFLLPNYHDELKFLATVLGGSAGIYTAYYVGATLKSTIEHNSLRSSFEITAKFDNLDLSAARSYVERELNHENQRPEEFYRSICEEEEIHSVVKTLLGMAEDVSLAVTSGYANEEILNRSLGYIVPWAYYTFLPYIEYERRRANDQEMYSELQHIAQYWKKDLSVLTGKKVPWYPSP